MAETVPLAIINPCQISSCTDGNCPGCRNGQLFCDDVLCHPNCAGCPKQPHRDSSSIWLLIFIIIVIFIIILIIHFYIRANKQTMVIPFYTSRPQQIPTAITTAIPTVSQPVLSSPVVQQAPVAGIVY